MEDTTNQARRLSTERHEKHRHRHRSRSRSPRAHKHQKTSHREDHKEDHRENHRDGRSERHSHRDHRDRRHHHRHRSRSADRSRRRGGGSTVVLPHNARKLVANTDYNTFEPLFAHFLDQEKHVVLADLKRDAKKDSKTNNKYEREIQSRWRRFVEKWNGHELDDRWYEPMLFLRVVRARDNGTAVVEKLAVGRANGGDKGTEEDDDGNGNDDNDDYGPALPPDQGLLTGASSWAVSSFRSRHLGMPGPAIPSRADLDERRALDDDARDAERAALRLARRADRAEQRERLDELAPRAAAGTRERQLEKKRELNDKMRGFRDRSPGGGGLEMGDDELMGDDGGSGRKSARDLQKEAETVQARRTYWQQRREEEQRAHDEELNERRAQYRAREAETMDMLRELARQRFG